MWSWNQWELGLLRKIHEMKPLLCQLLRNQWELHGTHFPLLKLCLVLWRLR